MKPYSYTANALLQCRSACPEGKIRQLRVKKRELLIAMILMFGKKDVKSYNH